MPRPRRSLGEKFDEVYRRGKWGRDETRSGRGSRWVATRTASAFLTLVVDEYHVGSVLNVGCGEDLWTPDLPRYVGVDAAGRAIARARERHPGRDYRVLDASIDPLPRADLVLLRDVTQHLPFRHALDIFAAIEATGARFLITSTTPTAKNSRDIRAGGLRMPNLSRPPFGFRDPLDSVADDKGTGPDRGKRLALYSLPLRVRPERREAPSEARKEGSA